MVLKSWRLNLLEPSGHVKACNGIALRCHWNPSSDSRAVTYVDDDRTANTLFATMRTRLKIQGSGKGGPRLLGHRPPTSYPITREPYPTFPDVRDTVYIYYSHHNQRDRNFTTTIKDTGKAVPLQAWSGPEGSRKLRFPDFMTTAHEGGKVLSVTHRLPLTPGNTPGTHFC
jgi:hypothetical protein